jgi:hypothetical protein
MTLYTIAPLRDDPLVSLPAVAPDQRRTLPENATAGTKPSDVSLVAL